MYKDIAYYSTIYGIGTFTISSVSQNIVPPKLVLSYSSISNDQIFTTKGSYKYNSSFTFKFDLISFKEFVPLQLFYQLKGYDVGWKSNESGELSYTNLPNGNYDLLVYVQNSSGIKSKIKDYHFSIQTYFFQTWWFITLVIFTLLWISYGIYKIAYYFIDKREVKKTRINKMLAEYQLMGLKAQMNPHFIFNCLNSIQKYVLDHDSKLAYTYMAKFSKLIRFVLDISDKTFVALSYELEVVKIYAELEQLRFDSKFNFEIEISESIKSDDILVPSLLIQPYLENAIWHGIMNLPIDKKGEVKITVNVLNDILKIVITDNGIGRAEAKLFNEKTHQSKGLSINQKRIEAINYLLKTNDAIVTIEDLINSNNKAAGTKVIIKLPIKYEE